MKTTSERRQVVVDEIASRPYRPGAACEACVFGSGKHALWCSLWERERKHVDKALNEGLYKFIMERESRTPKF